MTVLNRRSPYRNWRMDQAWGQNFTFNRASPQYDGLVAWWPLGVGQYGMVRDVMGRFHIAAFNTPILARDGTRGIATLFDASTFEYLEVDIAPVVAAPLTMATWVFPHRDANFEAVVFLGDKDTGNNFWQLQTAGVPGGDPVRFRCSDAGGLSIASTTSGFVTNTWQHICGVAAATNDRAVFINGGSKGVNGVARTPAGVDRVSIARAGDSTPGDYYDGGIADVRIYNRALSDMEVYALYTNPWDLYLPTKRAFFMVVPAVPVGAIMNQIQFANLGADLYNGTLL